MVSQDLLVVTMKMILLLRVLQLIQVAYLKKMFQLVKIIQANKMIKPENWSLWFVELQTNIIQDSSSTCKEQKTVFKDQVLIKKLKLFNAFFVLKTHS